MVALPGLARELALQLRSARAVGQRPPVASLTVHRLLIDATAHMPPVPVGQRRIAAPPPLL